MYLSNSFITARFMPRHKLLQLYTCQYREYWMIYRGQGFLAVAGHGSSHPPSLPSPVSKLSLFLSLLNYYRPLSEELLHSHAASLRFEKASWRGLLEGFSQLVSGKQAETIHILSFSTKKANQILWKLSVLIHSDYIYRTLIKYSSWGMHCLFAIHLKR